jgi:DNA polymerase III epsilon subunit-like protein
MKINTRKRGGSGRGRGRGHGRGSRSTHRLEARREEAPAPAAPAPASAPAPAPVRVSTLSASAPKSEPSVIPNAASPMNKMLANAMEKLLLSLTPKQQELYKITFADNNAEFLMNIKKNNRATYLFNQMSDVIGLDCEMISTHDDPMALASVSIIKYDGTSSVYYVHYPKSAIKSYKFEFSGITEKDIEEKGLPFELVQNYIKKELYGKRIVGHGLDNDFKALKISVPDSNIWDTTRIRHFMSNKRKEVGKNKNNNPIFENILNRDGNKIPMPRRLQHLAKEFLGINIQKKTNASGKPKGHNAIEDAAASLELYKWAEKHKAEIVPNLNETQFVEIESTD